VTTNCDVVIIGGGPYGLSIAAHLKALRVEFRIFGNPMHTWQTQMPKDMHLKSEGFASSLSDPDSAFTLEDYCKEQGLPYSSQGLPVPLATFIAYGRRFQEKLVPMLENKLVTELDLSSQGFKVSLEDGEVILAKKVVVATGLSNFGYVPPVLSGIPEELLTHSSKHSTLDRFRGREVTVVGAGASALDLAALLNQAGAAVQVVARKPVIRFHDPPGKQPRPLLQRMRLPTTGIGPGWKLFFCCRVPHWFRFLPEQKRLEAVRKILGPAPGWFIKDQVVGKIPLHLGLEINRASVQNGRVSLHVTGRDGAFQTITSDHVISATGFRVDLRRLGFLSPEIQNAVRMLEHAPILSSYFQSSVPGLYFVGTAAANSFGPLMRFAFGAGFTAPRISRHVAKSVARS
jgi:lysine/ornithine N-monooxygenase